MITIDASDASRLAAQMAAHTAAFAAEVQAVLRTQGPVIAAEVKALAPETSKVPGYSGTIRSKVTGLAAGGTITVESSSPFGFILEFGAGHSGPHPHFGPALEPAAARLETLLSALADKGI